jgi:hypothetical protein
MKGSYRSQVEQELKNALTGGSTRRGPIAPFRPINSIRGKGQAKEHDSHANDYRSDHLPLLWTGICLVAELV